MPAMTRMRRREWIGRTIGGGAGLIGLAAAPPAWPRPKAPFKRLAAIDPPFVEEYEVLIAMAPPLARGTIGKLANKVATEADSVAKTEAFTRAVDPEKTNLHGHFVQALAEEFDEAGVKTVLVQVDPADNEAALVAQAREGAPDADAVLLANVMGRFVAMHGLSEYLPGVMLGVKLRSPTSDAVWLENVYTTGFRGLDLRATHVDLDFEERYVNFENLMRDMSQAREALIRGVEQIAVVVAKAVLR